MGIQFRFTHTLLNPNWFGTHPANSAILIPQTVEMFRIATASPRHRRPVLVRTATFCYIEHPGVHLLTSFVLNTNMLGHVILFYFLLRILDV